MAWTPGPEYYHQNLSSTVKHTDTFDAGQFGYIEVSFAGSGTVRIYSEGDCDTIGYLTLSPSINTSTGVPSPKDNILAESDDIDSENRNFEIVYDDIEAGTTYYIWYRMYSQSEAGQITIYIEPPEPDDYVPDYSNIELNTDVDGTEVVLVLSGLDPEYDGMWNARWMVVLDGDFVYDVSYGFYGSVYSISLDEENGLLANTEYDVLIIIYHYDSVGMQWGDSISGKFTTGSGEDFDESGAKLNLSSSADGRTISAYVSGLDTSYSRDDRSIVWSLDGDPKEDAMDVAAGVSVSGTATWTGLTPGTTYTVGAAIWYTVNGVSKVKSLSGNITTNAPQRPAKFKWADGTTEKESGQEFDITADEWCDLLDNINAVREYKGYSKFTEGSYSGTYYYNYFTYPSSGDTFRYQHYNQALNAITGMKGSGYNENAVVKGAAVTADRINYLVSTLNGIT